jgi:hypothetical protein
MAKYHAKQGKPVEGFEFNGDQASIPNWALQEGVVWRGADRLYVPTRAGKALAHTGDHVLRRKPGDCYVVDAETVSELFEIQEG